jgi:hypothetical protein
VRAQKQEFHAAEPARIDALSPIATAFWIRCLSEIEYAKRQNGFDKVLVKRLA